MLNKTSHFRSRITRSKLETTKTHSSLKMSTTANSIAHASNGGGSNSNQLGRQAAQQFSKSKASGMKRNSKGGNRPRDARPTHFLCLPIGHHPALQEKMSKFNSSLLQGSVAGLDPSILIKPRKLHFTLGVMSLLPSDQIRRTFETQSESKPDTFSSSNPPPQPKTVESALGLLRSLQPKLIALCETGKRGRLEVSLERAGAFETRDGARVMWVSPREDEGWLESEEELEERLKLGRVAEMVHQAFRDAGYITETRPLKLHCTLINTSHRKPFSRNSRLFSFTDVLASKALTDLRPLSDKGDVAAADGSLSNRMVRVSLGTYEIPEIQLCAMGSSGPEGEYVSLGSVKFSAAGSDMHS
ncbi:AKAP7 2'5' RNA ligase-like domain-containing protein [Lentinula raphanica]|nr:AKAP7 2'5' RNA ligase-like domain-containing protein [Lentinula raphanica]